MTYTEHLKTAMARAINAKKEHGSMDDVLRRYSSACEHLRILVDVDIHYREIGNVSLAWWEANPIQRQRVLLKFWREMIEWLLLKGAKRIRHITGDTVASSKENNQIPLRVRGCASRAFTGVKKPSLFILD